MNYYKTEEVLLNVWSRTVIDVYPVECNAVPIGEEYIQTQIPSGYQTIAYSPVTAYK